MKDKAIAILLCASAFLSGLAQAQPTSTTAPGQKPVSRVSPLADGVELTAGTLVLRITALSPSVVRLRYAPTGIFGADSSFAVVKETGFVVPKVDVADFSDNVVLKTGELVVTIQKPSLRVVFADNAGRAIRGRNHRGQADLAGRAPPSRQGSSSWTGRGPLQGK